ncbi:MAG: RES family NAD+ phosphorylase [Akkermansiaceae bacterium]
MSVSRPIRLPAADFYLRPLPLNEFRGLDLLRIHGAKYPALQFRLNESHRFSHPEAPGGLLYLGEDRETCLWECFGEEILNTGSMINRAIWGSRQLSKITSPAVFKICDLTELTTRRLLALDLSALKHTELDVPQAWGLAIQGHPEKADGLRYLSRFTGRPCLALFERAGTAAKLKEIPLALLPDLDETEHFLVANAIALI